MIDRLRRERLEHPQLLVEAPVEVVSQELQSLPAGVRLEPLFRASELVERPKSAAKPHG